MPELLIPFALYVSLSVYGTRVIVNEIENYLCDLGPGINLF